MRLTLVLYRQPLNRWFNRYWYFFENRQRVPIETHAEAALQKMGIKLTDPFEVINEKKHEPYKIDVIGMIDKPQPMDESHPLHHERECFLYGEKSVLVEGLPQAQNLSNTVILDQGLPEKIEQMAEENKKLLPKDIDERVQGCILRSHLFDAVQEKLPRIVDPERPAVKLPRIYGVPDFRKNRLMSDSMLQLSDSISTEAYGLVVRTPQLRTFIDNSKDLIRYDIAPAMITCGNNPLKSFADPAATTNFDLPDISPFEPFVSIPTNTFYEDTEVITVPPMRHIHTAVFHFNDTTTVNLSEVPVNENQIQGRTLINSYITAVALAKQKYENPTGVLAKPVTVQGIHTNGQWFQFAVMQLNTLGNQGVRNVAWLSPVMHMFSSCKYLNAKPTIAEYNPAVFQYLHAFHRNSVETK